MIHKFIKGSLITENTTHNILMNQVDDSYSRLIEVLEVEPHYINGKHDSAHVKFKHVETGKIVEINGSGLLNLFSPYHLPVAHVNEDIQQSIDSHYFKSFQGVTTEGKIIQIDLPLL